MSRAIVRVRTAGAGDGAAVLRLADVARTGADSQRAVAAVDAVRLEAAMTHPDVQVLLAEGPDSDHPPVGLLVLRRGELLPLSGSEAAQGMRTGWEWCLEGIAGVLDAAA